MPTPTAALPRARRETARRKSPPRDDTRGAPMFHRDRPVSMTKAEWERFAETAPYRHEWLGRQPVGGTDDDAVGEVRPVYGYDADGEPAMSSRSHSILISNLTVELRSVIGSGPFDIHSGHLAVRDPIGPYYYPDVLISPYPAGFEPHRNGIELYLLNPLVVFEVLSPSTARVDRGLVADGGKRTAHLRIDTVTDYLLVAQDRPHVTHLRRDGDRWAETVAEGPDAAVTLADPAATLPLATLHRRVPVGE